MESSAKRTGRAPAGGRAPGALIAEAAQGNDRTGWNAAPDEEIVRRVQQGDRKLFSVIFERHYGRIERYLRQVGVSEADLEDVLAESFSCAFARVQSFKADSGTRYVSYLYAIARN